LLALRIGHHVLFNTVQITTKFDIAVYENVQYSAANAQNMKAANVFPRRAARGAFGAFPPANFKILHSNFYIETFKE